MNHWQDGFVETNGIRIHYTRTGGDKPQLVLAHGATDNGLCWRRTAQALEGEYDILMLDARGHGLSDKPESGYAPADHAADVVGLIAGLGLDRPVLMGHSMGAATTAAVAGLYPQSIRAAILEDPGWRPTSMAPADWEARMDQMRRQFAVWNRMSREELLALGRKQSPTWDEAEFPDWADSKLQFNPVFMGGLRQRSPRWQDAAQPIAVPALLITGDPEQGAIVTPDVAAEATALNPHISVVHLAGAGHNIRRERFDGFLAAVRTFLAGV